MSCSGSESESDLEPTCPSTSARDAPLRLSRQLTPPPLLGSCGTSIWSEDEDRASRVRWSGRQLTPPPDLLAASVCSFRSDDGIDESVRWSRARLSAQLSPPPEHDAGGLRHVAGSIDDLRQFGQDADSIRLSGGDRCGLEVGARRSCRGACSTRPCDGFSPTSPRQDVGSVQLCDGEVVVSAEQCSGGLRALLLARDAAVRCPGTPPPSLSCAGDLTDSNDTDDVRKCHRRESWQFPMSFSAPNTVGLNRYQEARSACPHAATSMLLSVDREWINLMCLACYVPHRVRFGLQCQAFWQTGACGMGAACPFVHIHRQGAGGAGAAFAALLWAPQGWFPFTEEDRRGLLQTLPRDLQQRIRLPEPRGSALEPASGPYACMCGWNSWRLKRPKGQPTLRCHMCSRTLRVPKEDFKRCENVFNELYCPQGPGCPRAHACRYKTTGGSHDEWVKGKVAEWVRQVVQAADALQPCGTNGSSI